MDGTKDFGQLYFGAFDETELPAYTAVGYEGNVAGPNPIAAKERKSYEVARQKAEKLAEFEALLDKQRRYGDLTGPERDYVDQLWNELGIPGDFRSGPFGNQNIANYISPDAPDGSSEHQRWLYLENLRKQINTHVKNYEATGNAAGDPTLGTQPGGAESPTPHDKALQDGSLTRQRADYFQHLGSEMRNRDGVQMDASKWEADRDLDLQSRAGLAQTEQMYRAAAEGRGPSAAQAQFQSALDQTNRNAMSLANSARGGMTNRALAQGNAQQQAGLNNAIAASQSAALRAQEQQAAMEGLSRVGQAMRTGDLQRSEGARGWETAQAGFSDAQRARNDQADQFYQNLAIGQRDRDYQARLEEQRRRMADGWQRFATKQTMENQRHNRSKEEIQMWGNLVQGGLGAITGGMGAVGNIVGAAGGKGG
jgi:hypothetical protein